MKVYWTCLRLIPRSRFPAHRLTNLLATVVDACKHHALWRPTITTNSKLHIARGRVDRSKNRVTLLFELYEVYHVNHVYLNQMDQKKLFE